MTKLLATIFSITVLSISTLNAQNKIHADELEKHVVYLASDELEGRGLSTACGEKAAAYIIEHFKSFDIKPYGDTYLHNFSHRLGQTNIEGNNVVGIIEGSDPILKNEYILLGAHYDHIGFKLEGNEKIVYNGADDNASGVSTIIELGRLLAENKSKLKRSIILVGFDGEESGLIGSNNMVKDAYVPLEKIKVMFSIDMVGMLNTNQGLEMKGIELLNNWQELFVDQAAKHNIKITKKGDGVVSRTDTKPFGDVGIPAISVTTGTKSPYHKPEDDADLLEYDGMEKVANFMYDVTLKLAIEDEISSKMILIAADEKESKSTIFEYGVRLNLGGNKHNYDKEFFLGKPVFAFEGGVYGKLNMGKRWAFQPELLYSTLGSDYISGKYRTHSISVPVNILFALATTNGVDGTFYLMSGGYYSYFFGGKLDGKKADFDNVFEDSEYGLNAGFIFEIENVQLGFTSKIGLSNLHQDNSLKSITNQGSYFTLGMRF
ncbi:MAG: M20/M25/M40 family metallo-hydrolase [Salinivirgaceae bacterium]|nr:M20/M25/M40 family metallo-hydrolase [Salinivirgaceae bacterium]